MKTEIITDGEGVGVNQELPPICRLTTIGETLIFDPPLSRNEMAFSDDNNKEVGRLSWGGGTFKFTGNTEESAKIFFNFLEKLFTKRIG